MKRRAMFVLVAMVGVLVVGSGVALAATITCGTSNPCNGTSDPDVIDGDISNDAIYAFSGDDVVNAFGGSDVVFGDEGNDIVEGFSGGDLIYGGPDADGSAQGKSFGSLNLEGSEDSDQIYGEGGNDWIDAATNDGPSQYPDDPVDESFGGVGNDHIKAADGYMDMIDCGKGKRDVAIFDKGIDTITGCETKIAKQ